LAWALWPLGEVDHARRLSDEMVTRALEGGHVPTIVWAQCVYGMFDVMCGRPATAAPHVRSMVALAREHGMALWTAFGGFLEPWVGAYSGDLNVNIRDMRRGIATLREQGVYLYGPNFETTLAAAEAEAGEVETALDTAAHAIAETQRTGQCWCEADAHRIRGEILLKHDPANTAPAEDAFLTAIAIAQQQKARSFELRAALSLAKLYQSTGRAADGHSVLAPALKGFSPTPEFPEIEEAQALLAALV
jgi:predicted ATPase